MTKIQDFLSYKLIISLGKVRGKKEKKNVDKLVDKRGKKWKSRRRVRGMLKFG